MNVDLPTAISILGALVSVGAAVAVTYAKLTAIDTRMGERLEALKERVDGALRDHSERIATTEARTEVNATKIAVVESQVGSLREMRSPVWRNGKDQ